MEASLRSWAVGSSSKLGWEIEAAAEQANRRSKVSENSDQRARPLVMHMGFHRMAHCDDCIWYHLRSGL